MRQSRPYPAGFKVKQARVVKRAFGFYVMLCFQAQVSVSDVPLTGKVVGVDVGLEYFLSTSNGVQIARPRFFLSLQRQLKVLQRRLKKKVKGSSNWLQQQRQISRLHERIAKTRKDFHFKMAHQLCELGDVIAVEDLNVVGLSRGMLGKPLLDAGLGQFLHQILRWVCFKRGKGYVKVDARGTSQVCPDCGHEVKKQLAECWHRCPSCGSSMPRDVASAIVIQQRAVGRTVLENACGEIRLPSSPESVK